MAEIDVSQEPPSGEFFHQLSGRYYRIYRDGETLRLREFVKDSNDREFILSDHAADYAFGSGNYARMYLIRNEDFLIEAPMTWYPRRNQWGMSAGYEKNAQQEGFGREIGHGCLHCHAGQVEAIGGSSQKLKVMEMAISCERCHGPGSLHVKERKADLPIRGDIDDSIVNLKHLSRERHEDVCSQCHLSGAADVSVRGRSVADFRPGLKMSDFRISYRVDRPDAAMTVSGQIEQMRLSRCYIESERMTCATCHNPHAVPEAHEKVAYYRNKCLSCHESQSCGLTETKRRVKQPNDNCISCHMPRGPTDIPHFSFTHHRIGIHKDSTKAKEKLTEADSLVPVLDVSHLPKLEQRRLSALANDEFAAKLAGGLDDESRDDPSYRGLATVFRNRARLSLELVRETGLREPEVEAFFSRLHWRKNSDRCISFAESALKLKTISPATRQAVLFNLATSYFDQRQFAEALPHLQELVSIQRDSISLMLLAICHQNNGDLLKAEQLILQAIRDSPERADLHTYLATIYQKLQKPEEAHKHLKWARLLEANVPQPQ